MHTCWRHATSKQIAPRLAGLQCVPPHFQHTFEVAGCAVELHPQIVNNTIAMAAVLPTAGSLARQCLQLLQLLILQTNARGCKVASMYL